MATGLATNGSAARRSIRKPSSTRKVFAASRAGVGGMPGSLPVTALRGGTMRGSGSAANRPAARQLIASASQHRRLRENRGADRGFILSSGRAYPGYAARQHHDPARPNKAGCSCMSLRPLFSGRILKDRASGLRGVKTEGGQRQEERDHRQTVPGVPSRKVGGQRSDQQGIEGQVQDDAGQQAQTQVNPQP